MFSNLTSAQKVAIASIILGAFAGSAAQFTPIVGATIATDVATVAAFLNGIVGGLIFIITGQKSQVQNVAAMPGVETIRVNAQANPTLAQIAVDPGQEKVAPTQAASAAVETIAKSAA